jgi:hypothetical protein
MIKKIEAVDRRPFNPRDLLGGIKGVATLSKDRLKAEKMKADGNHKTKLPKSR